MPIAPPQLRPTTVDRTTAVIVEYINHFGDSRHESRMSEIPFKALS